MYSPVFSSLMQVHFFLIQMYLGAVRHCIEKPLLLGLETQDYASEYLEIMVFEPSSVSGFPIFLHNLFYSYFISTYNGKISHKFIDVVFEYF